MLEICRLVEIAILAIYVEDVKEQVFRLHLSMSHRPIVPTTEAKDSISWDPPAIVGDPCPPVELCVIAKLASLSHGWRTGRKSGSMGVVREGGMEKDPYYSPNKKKAKAVLKRFAKQINNLDIEHSRASKFRRYIYDEAA
jgi:hypothetical protein